jgi:hypothetical protein
VRRCRGCQLVQQALHVALCMRQCTHFGSKRRHHIRSFVQNPLSLCWRHSELGDRPSKYFLPYTTPKRIAAVLGFFTVHVKCTLGVGCSITL